MKGFLKFGKKNSPKFDKSILKARVKMSITRLDMYKAKTLNSVKVQKRQIAKLLAEEKDESARIKVESVIRDEFLVDAIEIIQMFLELLSSRVGLVAETKSCPHDMKECITTLIYVANRMDNVPELLAVRSQFVAKYGKPFVRDAMNNTDLSVNKRVMWKMSLKVPEPSLCISYLKAIAKEFDVEWEESPELVNPFGTGPRQQFNEMQQSLDFAQSPPLQQQQQYQPNPTETLQPMALGGGMMNQQQQQQQQMNPQMKPQQQPIIQTLSSSSSSSSQQSKSNNNNNNNINNLPRNIDHNNDNVTVQNVNLQASLNFLKEVNEENNNTSLNSSSSNNSDLNFMNNNNNINNNEIMGGGGGGMIDKSESQIVQENLQPKNSSIQQEPSNVSFDFDALQKRFEELKKNDGDF